MTMRIIRSNDGCHISALFSQLNLIPVYTFIVKIYSAVLRGCILIPAISLISCTSPNSDIDQYDEFKQQLANRIDLISEGFNRISGYGELQVKNLLVEYYSENNFTPAWVLKDSSFQRANELLNELQTSYNEGLTPSDYHYEELQCLLIDLQAKKYLDPMEMSKYVGLELLLTDAYLLYAFHLYSGKVCPETVDPDWHADCKEIEIDYVKYLTKAVVTNTIGPSINELIPKHYRYQQLKKALAYYHHLEAVDFHPDHLEEVNFSIQSIDFQRITHELIVNGDLNLLKKDNGEEVEKAIIRFKRRHGLPANREIDSLTLAFLYLPLENKINIIRANMERWRWLPKNLGDKYVMVNIADFSLEVINNETIIFRSKVIVGRHYRETPVFSTNIIGIRINPYWTVPPTILSEDILPMKSRMADYLKRNHIRAFNSQSVEVPVDSLGWENTPSSFLYTLRQDPGAFNALGTIRFIMPNKYMVYLHDTPAKYLFLREKRTFSSGCIRVEKPYELAVKLLGDDGVWDLEKLKKIRTEEQNYMIWLHEPVRVHILYWTSWMDENNEVQFRKDVYNRDKTLIEALDEPSILWHQPVDLHHTIE